MTTLGIYYPKMKQFSNSRQPAEQSKTEGIVINISNYSEKDLILKVLTEEFGKISVFFRGAKNIKKNIPDLFDSGEFTLKKKSHTATTFPTGPST